MCFDMLLQVLGSLESFTTEFTLVRLQGHVDPYMRSDVVSFDCRGTTVAPLTSQIEIVGRFATNVLLTNVLLYPYQKSEAHFQGEITYIERLRIRTSFSTSLPHAGILFDTRVAIGVGLITNHSYSSGCLSLCLCCLSLSLGMSLCLALVVLSLELR